MLRLKNIHLTVGKDSFLQRKILNGLHLSVNKGEFVVVIGGNGSGKSTLFNVISGHFSIDEGTILLNNKDITKHSQKQRSQFIAQVMQDPKIGTIEQMTVYENMVFADSRGVKREFLPFQQKKRRSQYQERLSILEMNLENRMDEFVGNLSGGQRQALSLMMALQRPSDLLLLDEITAALDPKSEEIIMSVGMDLVKKQKQTTIMISHNMSHAIHYADRVYFLSKGVFTKSFSQSEIRAFSPSQLVEECFLN